MGKRDVLNNAKTANLNTPTEMKTEEDIIRQAYDEITSKFPEHNWAEFDKDHVSIEVGKRIIEITRSLLWTSPCDCPPDEKTGETLCCNHCGRPTARTTSKELPGDEEINDEFESPLDGSRTQFDSIKGAKWMRSIASPIIASRDARIRELEEWISVEDRLPEITMNTMSDWVITFDKSISRIDKAFYSFVTGWQAEHGESMNVSHWKELPTPPKN